MSLGSGDCADDGFCCPALTTGKQKLSPITSAVKDRVTKAFMFFTYGERNSPASIPPAFAADRGVPLRNRFAGWKSVPSAACRSLPRGPTSSPHGDLGAIGRFSGCRVRALLRRFPRETSRSAAPRRCPEFLEALT